MARPHETALDAVQVVGGALLVGALLVPWTSEGPASSIDAHRVGALLASGVLDSLVPRWGAILIYAGPLGGALAVVAVGLHSAARRWCERVAAALVLVTLVPASVLALTGPPGGGVVLTMLGGLAVLVSVVVSALLERRRPRPNGALTDPAVP